MDSQVEGKISPSQKESSSTSGLVSPSEDGPAHQKIHRDQLSVDQIKKIREERAQKRQVRRNSLISQGRTLTSQRLTYNSLKDHSSLSTMIIRKVLRQRPYKSPKIHWTLK